MISFLLSDTGHLFIDVPICMREKGIFFPLLKKGDHLESKRYTPFKSRNLIRISEEMKSGLMGDWTKPTRCRIFVLNCSSRWWGDFRAHSKRLHCWVCGPKNNEVQISYVQSLRKLAIINGLSDMTFLPSFLLAHKVIALRHSMRSLGIWHQFLKRENGPFLNRNKRW